MWEKGETQEPRASAIPVSFAHIFPNLNQLAIYCWRIGSHFNNCRLFGKIGWTRKHLGHEVNTHNTTMPCMRWCHVMYDASGCWAKCRIKCHAVSHAVSILLLSSYYGFHVLLHFPRTSGVALLERKISNALLRTTNLVSVCVCVYAHKAA